MAISITGIVLAEITSADIEAMLAGLSGLGVSIRHVSYIDSLTVRLEIERSDIKKAKGYLAKRNGKLKIIRKSGLYWHFKGLLKRPLLIIGLVCIMLLVTWLPTRVLFITVEGNESIPTRTIIEQANLCGITFGASRREVRSEKMKNSLLAAIPSLQWAGINTNGCTAVISVRERTQSEPKKEAATVSSIVAARDGVIESCTSQRGSLLCKPGQAVKQGDILISGYTDCGIKITAAKAEGEVFAQTRHELTVYTPTEYTQKGEVLRVEKKYGILIGKKRINFYKDSGISGTGCDKIYLDYYVTLPGGFQLPIAFFVCTTSVYDQTVISAVTEMAESTAQSYAQQYLLCQMISGRILHTESVSRYGDGVCVLTEQYICSEMIGRVRSEEIIGNYGEDN